MAGIAIPFLSGGGGSGVNLIMIMLWILLIILFCASVLVFVFVLIYLKKSTPIIEIDFINKRIKKARGVLKIDKKDGVMKFFIRKFKKKLKRPQQEDYFVKGKKDMLFMMKDNNGMHHPLRLPTFKEIKNFYLVNHKVDITQPKIKDEEGNLIENPHYKNYEIFFLPNPHEDLEWLANQCVEADKEFKDVHWWQHPNFMIIATAFICFMMFVVTMIVAKKV